MRQCIVVHSLTYDIAGNRPALVRLFWVYESEESIDWDANAIREEADRPVDWIVETEHAQ